MALEGYDTRSCTLGYRWAGSAVVMVESRSGSRRQLCNSERLQGGRAAKYVQFQKELRGTESARKAVWTSIC